MSTIQYDDHAEQESHMVEADDDYPNTIVAFFPDGRKQTVLVSTPTPEDGDGPEWFDEARVETSWVQTDGWRGHSTFIPPAGWESLTNGWVTGYPDESTKHKLAASDVNQALADGTIKPPVPLIWCFGITSNVFSMTSNVMIPEGTKDEVNEWLDSLSITDAESFDLAFS